MEPVPLGPHSFCLLIKFKFSLTHWHIIIYAYALGKEFLYQRAAIKQPSRVPAYLQVLKVVGFCNFQVKSLPWRGQRDLGLRLRSALPLATEGTQESILMKKGLGLLEDRRARPAKLIKTDVLRSKI